MRRFIGIFRHTPTLTFDEHATPLPTSPAASARTGAATGVEIADPSAGAARLLIRAGDSEWTACGGGAWIVTAMTMLA